MNKVNIYKVTFFLFPTQVPSGMSACRGPNLSEEVMAESEDQALEKVKTKVGADAGLRLVKIELLGAQG
jgi:hypothetical protein